MSKLVAASLFFILLFASLVGLSLSIAPGLSFKNLYLYLIIGFLLVRSAIEARSVSIFDEPIPFASLHIIFIGLIWWVIFSWLFMVFVATHIQYDWIGGLIALKGIILDLYLVFLAFFFINQNKDDVIWTAKAVVFFAVIYNLLTFLDAFNFIDFGLVGDMQGTKLWGPMGHANQYASFIIFFLPSIVALAFSSSGFRRWLFVIGAVASIIMLVATFARAAYFGLVFGTIITGYIYRANYRLSEYLRYLVLAFVAVVILTVVSGQWEALYERVIGMTTRAANADDVSSGRLGI